ncbi:hypothetical protein Tco_1058995, partial [Tanacetum coccineum]
KNGEENVRIKSLLEVTAANGYVTAAKQNLVLFRHPDDDYSLWEVIENGNAPPITKVIEGVETTIAPTTAKEKAQRRLELKARSTLLMGILNEHQLKFNSIKDAKSLLQAYENFIASSSEVLDQTFDRLQKNISQLEIHGKEPESKGTSKGSKHKHSTVAFYMSSNSTSSTNGAVNTAHGATTASTQATAVNSTIIDMRDCCLCTFLKSTIRFTTDNVGLATNSSDDLEEMDLRWQMAMLTMRARRFLKNTRRKFSVNGIETIGFDKSKKGCTVETTTSNALVSVMVLVMIGVIKQKKVQLTLHSWLTLLQVLTLSLEEFINEHIVSEPTVKKPVVETSEAKASAYKPKVIRMNFGPPLIKD